MIAVGESASVTRTFDAAEIRRFAALAGKTQPDPAHVPEPLIAALFSYLLGMKLPGAGTNYLKQEMQFPAAAAAGEPLTAVVTVTRVRPEKRLVDLETICRTATGTIVCKGRALVLAKPRFAAA
jgi:acyl dehydratase